jgi:hypothetical protein
MTSRPMSDHTFGLVTANVAIRSIKDRELRRTAIGQMHRVVKPGGTILVVGIQYTGEHREDLDALGAEAVSVRGLEPGGWFGSPFFASRLVAARRPSARPPRAGARGCGNGPNRVAKTRRPRWRRRFRSRAVAGTTRISHGT